MAAFIPSRKDPAVNEVALAKVREDKQRESGSGFDGTWVAHPDLVPVATAEFDAVLGQRRNQLGRSREDVSVGAAELLDFHVPGGEITGDGLRPNVSGDAGSSRARAVGSCARRRLLRPARGS